jgi:hypothetical protein
MDRWEHLARKECLGQKGRSGQRARQSVDYSWGVSVRMTLVDYSRGDCSQGGYLPGGCS